MLSLLNGSNGLGQTFSTYKCNSTICYGTDGGKTHALFKETQYQMNRAGSALFGPQWVPIKVDGFIGSGTLSAARRLFPKVPEIALAGWSSPKTFVELSQVMEGAKNTSGEPLILAAVKLAADRATGRSEPAGAVTTRVQAFTHEGPAKSTATDQPVVSIPGSTGANQTAVTQVPSDAQAAYGGGAQKSGRGFVWVIVGVAAVGIIGTAVMVQRRRRRRRSRAVA